MTRKAISKGLERRFKNCDGEEFFFKKINFFGKWLIKSTSLGFDPETVTGPKIQYLSFLKLIYFPLYCLS